MKPEIISQKLYNVTEVARRIGRSPGYVSSVKRAMGNEEKRLFNDDDIQEMCRWLMDHPKFRVAQVKPPKPTLARRK